MTSAIIPLVVEVLYSSPIAASDPRITSAITTRLPTAKLHAREVSVQLMHLDTILQLKDGSVPVGTVVFAPDGGLDRDVLAASVQQTWDWPDAGEVAMNATTALRITDMFAFSLEPARRLRILQQVLLAVMSGAPPLAVHWVAAQKVSDPASVVSSIAGSEDSNAAFAALNVRMFRADADFVMDTMGLSPFGLPDLQMHFRGLEPGAIARMLYNLAFYVFERGDVIEDGHTVDGPRPGLRWRCQHEMALVGPDRVVLDIDPGPSYAAGGRVAHPSS